MGRFLSPLLIIGDICITLALATTVSIANVKVSKFPVSVVASPVLAELPPDDEDLPNNAPLLDCGPTAGVEDGEYMELVGQYMDPPCEDVNGYCRIRRNTNYTVVVRYIPKVNAQSLHVRITVVQPYGWETRFWPEYGVCGYFNITCPMEADNQYQAWNEDELPDQVPPTRGLFRVRLIGTSVEDETKRIYMCRQVYLQLY